MLLDKICDFCYLVLYMYEGIRRHPPVHTMVISLSFAYTVCVTRAIKYEVERAIVLHLCVERESPFHATGPVPAVPVWE